MEEREIHPSKRAWDEISAAVEGQKVPGKGTYFWYGIAAGFIGLLIVSVIYFTSTNPLNPGDIKVVDTPVDEDKEEQITLPKEQDNRIPELIKEEVREVETKVAVEKPKKSQQKFSERPETVIAQSEVKNEQPKVNPVPSETIIDTKLMEVIAQVNLMEKDENRLTDIEVDSLLRKAQGEILKEQIFKQDNSVDATALLSQVEDELDQSFRDQIFEKLKTGFIKVRTAVADRNN